MNTRIHLYRIQSSTSRIQQITPKSNFSSDILAFNSKKLHPISTLWEAALRYLLSLLLIFSITACEKKKDLTTEDRQKVLLEEFETTKKLMLQSKFMSGETTDSWIKEFTTKFKLNPKDVEKNGFQMEVINAKALQIGSGNVIAFTSTWQLTMLVDTKTADGKVARQKLPAVKSVIYLWEPAKATIQTVLDSGFALAQAQN
jgi:hypothetical protein